MKILIYTLALISAFFVSSEPITVQPQPSSIGLCKNKNGSDLENTTLDGCLSYIESWFITNRPNLTFKEINPQFYFTTPFGDAYRINVTDNRQTYIGFAEYIPNQTVLKCPDSHPIETPNPDGSLSCSQELQPEPEPCSEFGNNSFLPNKSGVGQAGQNACYTNPTTGQQCQFKQGHDNFTATGKTCDGDENDYGDKPTPEPPPDGGDDNCYNYGSQGQVLICDVDPNEGCNAIVVSGQQQYQCPHGCGSMDGVYFCTYDDKDGDGIPDDKNGNGVPDKDETCVNGKCKPKNPDDNTTPTPETPDMTQTNTRLDSVIGELDSIGGNIRKTNQTLDGINSGIQGIKQGQDKSNGLLTSVEKNTKLTADNTDVIAGNTKGILDSISETDIGDSFNPEGSSSFYESVYENGWQGVWDEKSDLISQTGLFVFLKQFRLTSGGSAPEMNICFDVLVNLGCKTLDPNWERLMPFLRICIFITAAFVCRRIIFGG